MSEHRYDPHEIEPRWQALWARGAHLGGRQPRGGRGAEHRARERAGQLLRARDAALPERRAAHRPPQELRDRRRHRPLPPPPRPARAAPDGLRRLRPAGREPRDRDRRAPARLDRRVDRRPSSASSARGASRSTGRASSATHEPALLPLDAVDLPRAVRAPASPTARRPRSTGARTTQTVLANEQVDRRPLRALRRARRGAPARAVVLPHHRLRRAAARRPRHDRLARARQDDAAQLDRPLARAPR